MKTLSVRSLGSLLVCDGAWEGAGPDAAYIYEPLDVALPNDAEAHRAGSRSVRFYYGNGERVEALIHHHEIMGDLVLLDDGRWYEVTGGQVTWRDGRWYLRWLGASNTKLSRMLNAVPPKLARHSLRLAHAGGGG